MSYWLLGALLADVLILVLGLPLQGRYLRHLRHHHRPIWEEVNRRAPRSWRHFKGMPSTGLLICSFIARADYRDNETRRGQWLGYAVLLLNGLHLAAWGVLVGGGIAILISGGQ